MLQQLTILGSGPSSGCPVYKCFVTDKNGPCERCIDGVKNPLGPNNRNNPCALLTITTPSSSSNEGEEGESSSASASNNNNNKKKTYQILLDTGKTMRDVILRFLIPRNITRLDAIIHTHPHADAMLGVKEVKPLCENNIPVFTDKPTFDSMERTFPEIFPNASSSSNEMKISPQLVTPGEIFEVPGGLQILPLLVDHGIPCLAFVIPLTNDGKLIEGCDVILYISDVNNVPEESRKQMMKYKPKLLLLDLLRDADYTTHFGKEGAKTEAARINAEKTIFFGSSHGIDKAVCTKEFHDQGLTSYSFAQDGDDVYVRQ